ncbi:uroporphyrinogen decarboxylase family protein [Pseudomonas aegrilactucae]|uniref:Uroporphyrinogen decarboxylase (URO-D) domain-containing protein n=1 Tax=Pseudomonas aegrilactucae TaxID=2854028 RepID=A0A9Q2XL32_9PSED|nr:uroporphyrinogen decarboxylase family protein [Pseudomonas aegrilactucae]MBV6288264.1 hypothetical protein [Pseudomonas aegrilactucae]
MSYPSLHNNTFIKALLRQPTAHTPAWRMRQAGRYLPDPAARVDAVHHHSRVVGGVHA